MGRAVVCDEDTGDGTVETPRAQLHELIETLTEEAIPPVLAVLLLWLEGPRALLPVWGLAFVLCAT
jgi:hypothetical protein